MTDADDASALPDAPDEVPPIARRDAPKIEPRPLDKEAQALDAELGDDADDEADYDDETPVWVPLWERVWGPMAVALIRLRMQIHALTEGRTFPDLEASARALGPDWSRLLARAEAAAYAERSRVREEKRRRKRVSARANTPRPAPAQEKSLPTSIETRPAVSPTIGLRERLAGFLAQQEGGTK